VAQATRRQRHEPLAEVSIATQRGGMVSLLERCSMTEPAHNDELRDLERRSGLLSRPVQGAGMLTLDEALKVRTGRWPNA